MQSRSPFPPGSLVAAYLRDSGGGGQDLSVSQQQAELTRFAGENGLIISRVFVDVAKTGTTTVGRESFDEMITYFQQNGAQRPETGIILWSFSRFAREMDDSSYYKAMLRIQGYEIHSLSDPIPSGLEKPDQRLLEAVYDYNHARFILTLQKDVKRGLYSIFREYGALGGLPPRGFMRETITLPNHRSGEKHTIARWVPDPDLWETCRLAWQMRAAGYSYREIHERTHLYSSQGSYATFFSNRIYLGEMSFGDEVVPNYAPALVDLDTWNKVQEYNHRNKMISSPKTGNPDHSSRTNSPYLLSGLAFCPCGAHLNSHKIKFSRGYIRTYYRCASYKKTELEHTRQIPAEELEEKIEEFILEKILSPYNLIQITSAYYDDYASHKSKMVQERGQIRRVLSRNKTSITHLIHTIKMTGANAAIGREIAELEEENTRLEEQARILDAALNSQPPKPNREELNKISAYLRQAIKTKETAEKRRFLRGIITKIIVNRSENQVEITIYYINPISIFRAEQCAPAATRTPVFTSGG